MSEAPKPSISRRSFLRVAIRTLAGSSLAALGVTAYATKVETRWLKLERLRIPIPALPTAFEGYRVVQLTDLHLSSEESRRMINHAVREALDRSPDLLVLTGDYVTGRLDAPTLRAELSQLSAPDGVWATLGNHDHWVDPGGVRQVLADAGIGELRNSSTPISREGQTLWLVGVDDIWEKQHDLPLALSNVPDDGTAILLAHEPDYADAVFPTGRIALQLSGHSHGGQVRLPLYGAPILPYLGEKYPYGLRTLGDMWLYTSQGVGYLLPIRLNCRPEVVEITLTRG
jgi:predicted MPP superfamily phosphohydrolase